MPRKRARKVRCPICKKAVMSSSPDFPFCSERCRTIDLGKWASGGYVISSPVTEKALGNPRASLWSTLIATFFGIGYMKPGPGTWGSAAGLILWAVLASQLPASARTLTVIILAGVVTLIGIPAATQVARAFAKKDPQFVVIDEVAGQLITLIAAPLTWKTFLA